MDMVKGKASNYLRGDLMVTNDQNPTAGIGDPYWYEWTIGQNYVVDMLNPDYGIESVTLQATEAQGLDDVVVVYKDGSSEYVQVKHTRKESTITFGNILPLLRSMSKAWLAQKNQWVKCTPVLLSNRVISSTSIEQKDKQGKKYERPALVEFLPHFQSEIKAATNLSDVQMPDEWLVAWDEWCEQLEELPSERDKLEFLKLLVIKGNHPGLEELTNHVTQKIANTFGISIEKAESVFSQLDHALREWGTTSRGDKEYINIEDVYEVLSMASKELEGDHLLMPPEPLFPSRQQFIEDLAVELLTGVHPITFLTGSPGQGKTSVVSALANRRDPVIDLRFHAFKPITPQTERLPADAGVTTKAEVLWGDLLTELRSFFFKGRLAQFNVPVRNDFLTLDQLITEVLRLANILGKERGRPTVIAIDGIDHAARAGVDQHSFLDTLIPPDAVPEHVRFLIVGQPAEAYEKYPWWLKESSSGVTNWIVEDIQEEDISELITTDVPKLSGDQFDATVRLIKDISQGNTLTAIFAIEEAKMTSNVLDLQNKLKNRRLTDGLSTYYNNIWSAAVARLEEKHTFVGQRLAGVLSLINERTTGQDLSKIFESMLDISAADWTEALRALRPLVVEESSGFRVTHNDIRVHLTRQIHAQPERLREIASLIADFYWHDPEKKNERHTSLFELLRKSDRHVDQARLFTPEFVMEGFALGHPLRELHDQCKHALLNVVDTEDWDCIHNLSCACTTLVQIHKSVEWMDMGIEYTPEVPPILFSEGRVPNQESWTLDVVLNTMEDAYRLIQENEFYRAYGLMRRWFTDITPIDFLTVFKQDLFEQMHDNQSLNTALIEVLSVWGRVSYHVGLLWNDETALYQTDDNTKKEIWAHFAKGLMDEALENEGIRNWIWSSQVSVYTSMSDVEEKLMQLAYKRRWLEIAYTLKGWSRHRVHLPKTFQIKAAALSLFTGREDLFLTWVQPIIDEGFNSLENIDLSYDLKEHTLLYCMVSFVLGWTQPYRENSGIAEEGANFYLTKRQDHRQKGHFSALLRGSALAGKWLGTLKRRGIESAQKIVTLEEVEQVFEVLVIKKRGFNERVYYHEIATKSIIEILIDCSILIGGEAERKLYSLINAYGQSYPVNYMMETTWRYLWDRGEDRLLEEWFVYWCGPSGKAWQQEIATRVDIVNRLASLSEEVGFEKEAKQARKIIRWGMVGYTGHKEYVLESPKEWYKELSKDKPEIWENEGKLLLEICQEATELGDNRFAIFVEAIVAGSTAQNGPVAMWRLLNAENMNEPLIENVKMIFDGLISMLETAEASEQDLLSIWCFGVGALNWQLGYDLCYLSDLKEAVLLAAQRNGVMSLEEKLNVLGPAEYHAIPERNRYRIPKRWFEDEGSLNGQDESEFYNLVQELPIEKAIDRLFESKEELNHLWYGIYLVVIRLKTEKPAGYPRHLHRIVEIVRMRNHSLYQWSGSKLYLVFQELIPLLRDSTRLDLLNKVIDNLDFEGNVRIWVDSAAENLDNFCRFRAVASNIEYLEVGLKRQLKLHEMWITGNGFLPDMKRMELPDVKQMIFVPKTWSEFAVQYFFRILNSNNLTRIELALRGLWSIAQVTPHDLKYIVENWGDLNLSAKERILLLVERAATSATLVYELFSEVVQSCYKGTDLSLKLQAWVILKIIERRNNESCPKWTLPISPEYDTFLATLPADRGVLDVPNIQRGLSYELHGNGMIQSLLRRLQVITMDDLDDVEHQIVSHLGSNVINPEPIEEISIKSGEMKALNIPHGKLLMKVIYHELYKGRWANVSEVELAQALLRSDEPFVLLQTPAPATDADNWVIDHELEELGGNKKKILERILPHIHAGVSDDEIVVGAVLHTFSRSVDVEVVLNTVLSDKGFELLPGNETSTMNGRTFLFYDNNSFEPQNITNPILSMTNTAGGIGEFNNKSMLCFPALIWTELFNWYPSEENPLIWFEEGEPVIRFEYVHGQFRDIAQDQLFRQPFLQRWVCSKETIRKLEKELDVTISPRTHVNVRNVRR